MPLPSSSSPLDEPQKIKPKRLLAEERRRGIVGHVEQHGRITIDEITHKFSVSAVTARGDLDSLSEDGKLVRSHGGGIKPLAGSPDYPLTLRANMHREEKARIAEVAVRLIQPFQTIILCTGSTSVELAAQIRRVRPDNITVITYALNIAAALVDVPGISLIVLGGMLRQVSNALVGPHAEQMMGSLHADHCFLSTVGLDVETGLTTLDIMEAQLNRCMIASAKDVTVLADSSKFGHRSLALISDFDPVRRVITDEKASAKDVQRLMACGVEVVQA